MGNDVSSMVAKNRLDSTMKDLNEGWNDLVGSNGNNNRHDSSTDSSTTNNNNNPNNARKKKEVQERRVQRELEYKQKKQEREVRKSKLTEQWAASHQNRP